MTEPQRKRFYFPAWSRACHANDWRMDRGRLVGKRAAVHGIHDVDALYQQVWTAAEQLALQDHCAVTADHLRHGCHVVALGKDKSANDLAHGEVDQVVNLFKLLADPDDLDAMIGFQHPENSERDRLVFSLKKRAPHARLLAIARNLASQLSTQIPINCLEDLPIEGLKQLSRIISRDQRNWNSPVAAPRESAGVEEPF